MKFRQIRNATVVITYAGKRFLIDPVFANKGEYPGFDGTLNSHLNWPLVSLPCDVKELIDVDAVIITHTHLDHFDNKAMQLIPKDMPMFVQDEKDKKIVLKAGFNNVSVLSENTKLQDITLIKTKGQHGSDEVMQGEVGEALGNVCGVVFSSDAEPNVYLAGDTIWNDFVENAIKTYSPSVIILNAGDARLVNNESIIMGKDDLLRTHNFAPKAKIIATHLEAVGHSAVTRKELREYAKENDIEKFVFIPDDGETLEL